MSPSALGDISNRVISGVNARFALWWDPSSIIAIFKPIRVSPSCQMWYQRLAGYHAVSTLWVLYLLLLDDF